MPIDDLISGLAQIGGEGKGWRSIPAILGAVLGVAIGSYLGWEMGEFMGALKGGAAGLLFGWLFGVVLRGLWFLLLIFIVVFGAYLAWEWLTGGAA